MATKKSPAKKPVVSDSALWPFPTGTAPEKTGKPKPTKRATPIAKPAQVEQVKPVHVVKASLSNLELAKAKSALTLDLYANNSKLGTLEVGSGSVYWTGSRKQKSKRIDWSKFAEIMNKLAYPND